AAWVRIYDWDQLSSIEVWSPTVSYANSVGKLVEYNGQIFRAFEAWPTLGQSPVAQPAAWQRILRWEETLGPILWTPGMHPAGKLFRAPAGYAFEYYVTARMPYTAGNPLTSAEYRGVSLYSPTQTYALIEYNTWDAALRYFCYTEENGQTVFWRRVGANTVVGQAPSDASAVWQRIMFECTENMVVTTVAGKNAIWTRNPSALSPIREPSISHNDWTRFVVAVANTVVFVQSSSGTQVYQKTIPGASTGQPGVSSDWQRLDYATGRNYAYTTGAAGISFWYSATQSATYPGGPAWTLLNANTNTVPDYVYIDNNGTISYMHTVGAVWRVLANAWTGTQPNMVYFWNAGNNYAIGDIVVYGTTLTNMYRYFTLTAAVRGANPMEDLSWQEIR
ncbi:MAG: hypothetical protein FWD32_01280, partial [Firmicutes bacterium]|nr:hypothetical protein [Bacillota bacterium]